MRRFGISMPIGGCRLIGWVKELCGDSQNAAAAAVGVVYGEAVSTALSMLLGCLVATADPARQPG
jgi:hypothetical protein